MSKKRPTKKASPKAASAKKPPRPAKKAAASASAGKPPKAAKTGKAAKTPAAKPAKGASDRPAKPAKAGKGGAAARESVVERPAAPKKSPLSKSELAHFEGLLLHKRDALVGDLRSLESQAFRASEQDSSANHMADYGSDNYEQDFNLGLIENEEEVVIQIDEALRRVNDVTYGVCLECGVAIPKARLEILPWSRFCVNCQSKAERF